MLKYNISEVVLLDLVIIGLLIFAIILLIISFFLRDPYKDLKSEFDDFSMQQIQETYQLKKKIKILEEELLMDDNNFINSNTKPKKEVHAIIKNQVWSLSQQGLSIEQIAKQSSLTPEEVFEIIQEFSLKGDRYE